MVDGFEDHVCGDCNNYWNTPERCPGLWVKQEGNTATFGIVGAHDPACPDFAPRNTEEA